MERLLWFTVCLTGSLSQNLRSNGITQTSGDPTTPQTSGDPTTPQTSGDPTTPQEVLVFSEEEMLKALTYGFNKASKLISGEPLGESSNTSVLRQHHMSELDKNDDASSLQFDFHTPNQESFENSCVGMGLLMAEKFMMEKEYEGIDPALLAALWKDHKWNLTTVDSQMCFKLTETFCGLKHLNKSMIQCDPEYPYRSYNGSCNNLENPLWGTTASPFVRFLEPDYGDGVQSLRGSGKLGSSSLPSARKVSVELQNTKPQPDLQHVNMMIMTFGQLLSHDLSLTPETAMKVNGTMKPIKCCVNGAYSDLDQLGECQPIDTSNDTFYQKHGKDCIPFVRSIPANKGCFFGAREQLNQQTAFLDVSMIYGPTNYAANHCRRIQDGKLKTSYMGGDKFDFLATQTQCKKMFPTCYLSGDGRVDESAGLTSFHTLFHRLHNLIVTKLAEINPHWEDEILYQEGRHIVVALWQQITFKEYLPLIVGPEIMKMYKLKVMNDGYASKTHYNVGCNPTMANVFPTAAFRFGHSMIKDHFMNGFSELPLQGNFFNISNFLTGKTCPSRILAGLAEKKLAGNDVVMAPVVFEHLFAPMGKPTGLDLMALNIQRGRDHGLPGYIEWRRVCKLSIPSDWNDLAPSIMNKNNSQAFQRVYKEVKDIDLFPAGLAEIPLEGALVGPTFACIIGQQFQNTKMGDRFWYENENQPRPFTTDQLKALRKFTFSNIICGCSGIVKLQPLVFQSFNLEGNSLKRCSSYEKFDITPWRVENSTKT